MSDEKEAAPAGKSPGAPAPPTLVGCIQATIFALAVLTAIGSVFGYLSALFVVKIGVGGPRLFVFVPMVAVTRVSWALSAHRGGLREVMVHGTSAVLGAGLAAGLIFGAHLPAPSSLLRRAGEGVTMPPFGLLVGEVAALACLAVAGGAIIRLARRGRDDGASSDVFR